MTAFDVRFLREIFGPFDDISKPIMGIKDWDDSACLELKTGKILVSCDGPYEKRLVLKSALIHAATDVVVKGGEVLFALDTLSGSREEVEEMAKSLKLQGEALGIPVVAGNTNLKGKPLASIFVLGRLMTEKPIRQSGGKKGDSLLLLGKALWGGREERIKEAKKLFSVWFELIGRFNINSAKDVTKGGLSLTAKEIARESGKDLELDDVKVHMTRNLDNFLISAGKEESGRIEAFCRKRELECMKVGRLK